MNILYIHTHDTGRYIKPYGHAVETPRLQALAQEGVLFRNNYCAGPTCSPSRSALLTGQYPHESGMLGLAHLGFSLKDYDMHLARYLGSHGFETALCGMQHEAADPMAIGYDHVWIHSKDGISATQWDLANGDSAIQFLKQKHEKPFFLSYGLEHTHRPFTELDDDIAPQHLRPPQPIPDHVETRRDMAYFLTSARRADMAIGRVLDALEESGLRDQTLILYTTDHGLAFPFMKCHLYDSGIGTAMILCHPDFPKGLAIDALTSHLDVYPTLCELLGFPRPEWLRGESLIPLLTGDQEAVRDEVFAGVTFHVSYEPQRAIRTLRYKYIRRYDPEHKGFALANIDNSPTKDFLLANGLGEVQLPQEELYDLMMDPNERNNLALHPDFQALRKELSGRLLKHMQETSDPLFFGEVTPPPGSAIKRWSCVNPESNNPDDDK